MNILLIYTTLYIYIYITRVIIDNVYLVHVPSGRATRCAREMYRSILISSECTRARKRDMSRVNPMAREKRTMLRETVGKDKGTYLSAYNTHNAARYLVCEWPPSSRAINWFLALACVYRIYVCIIHVSSILMWKLITPAPKDTTENETNR